MNADRTKVPAGIAAFLATPTPGAWLETAGQKLEELLLDHANCEKKAASSALSIIFRYPQHDKLVLRMSRLAREELRHFEQVNRLIARRGVEHRPVPASGYAGGLRAACRSGEPQRLIDTLIVGALIEARSCERFALLLPFLPADVAGLYAGLLESERRHFEVYLELAREQSDSSIEERVAELARLEGELVSRPDAIFAFHSGVPT